MLRDVEIYRPYGNEFPAELLWDAGADEVVVARWEAAELVRIAKIGERILGMYAMQPQDQTRYFLHGVVVNPNVRRQGLGRWLVGHAIGVAESKGGRHVLTPAAATRLFAHIGFVPTAAQGSDLRLDLIPE